VSQRTNRQRPLVICVAAITIGIFGFVGWYRAQPSNEHSPASSVAESKGESANPANNTTSPPAESVTAVSRVSYSFAQYGKFPDGYVGTAVCASCHTEQHESYLKTHHSRSIREVNLASEKVGETLHHPLSKRSYDILAKDGRLWHREWRHLSDAPNDRFQVNELPVCYLMGSGVFEQGYLLADGDYLVQSPVSWYVGGGGKLGMAPGFDVPSHYGFTRTISDECLFCHAGLVSQRGGNPHQPVIHELSIGCERCHGPGAEHSELYRKIDSGELKFSTDLDPKIVDPAQLDRSQSESICGQCHLHGDAIAHAAGAQIWDFVAGEELTHTRVHYKHKATGEFDKVFTAHFDQMWQSPCYQKTETLTCVTCHDPHLGEPMADQVAFRRQQCNECHLDQGCGLPLDQRIAREQNDCIKCHMPTIDSEIPHTSTTSHWIAVYDSGKPRGIESSPSKSSPIESSNTETLRRVQTSPPLSDQEIARRDVLAQSYWTVDQANLGNLKPLQSFTMKDKLRGLIRGDRTDAEIYSLLARMARATADGTTPENPSVLEQQWRSAATNATKSLQLEKRPVKARESALEVLGNQLMHSEDYASAVDCFSELTETRREAADWYNLGLCLARIGRLGDAELSLREAIRIDATYAAPYRSLSVLYRTINPGASRQFAVMAQRLMQP
jgi:hypothetical protein